MISIVLVDDHELYRVGLRAAISQMQGLVEIVGECSSCEELETFLKEQKEPGLIILDIWLPDGNGVNIARKLKKLYPAVKIIILSSEVSEKTVNELLAIDVEGYICKTAQINDIGNAIRTVTTGSHFYGKSVSKMILDICVSRSADQSHKKSKKQQQQQNDSSELTQREKEVVQYLCDGYSAKETAEKMHLSYRTVETHRSNILHKLGFSNAAELIRYAVKSGLVDWQ